MTEIKGGFVELDNEKLSRDQLVLLGMKMAMDESVHECRAKAAGLNPTAQLVMNMWADQMAQRRDNLSVVLTRSALSTKTGRFTSLKGE